MHFGLTEEQQMIVDTTRAFVENELYPHEMTVERTGHLPMELIKEIQSKAMAAGLYAANMPEEVGGAGLDTLTWLLYEKELGRANYALHWTCVARPSNILLAGNEEQRQQYLYPCIRGETWDCLAMTEPGAGSDLRGMKASARQDGDDWILNGTKHFISHADIAGFAIVFMATGEEQTPRGPKKKITAFFVDKGTKGFNVREGYRNVSHRGYTNAVLEFDDCRLNKRQILGEVHKGFEVANSWLGATRLQVASTCLGRAERALGHAISYAAEREQFGQKIGKFQGISFKLADMAMELKAAELLTREAAWKYDQGSVTEADMSMAKLKATEVLAHIADEAIQIHGGMGLMDELPLERIWRDARVERIWEGTSEIQRHIISRELLRPHGA
ncbi:MAG TPA: acyl-CoA dehydrogenase family protein [Albidovulum sp.]|uniref:acyl-CoA dehydrogenase family protein n=1 Tax=Albidovulum sp. TaxID=1872424 RepID=UPI002B6647C3|nr:acyl-CoA dehydrogenase family protein [Defluviimonas sp.]MCP5354943.1 acyl-CoA dehydrogenase family protein [Paracoccaceae bacterium]HPE26795.1 acyl-CoA dehydrogenase family protein [Albidovulum sp.]HRV63232.1 acyl-CoA dehydrogenase family protein [Albidovulum sp.]